MKQPTAPRTPTPDPVEPELERLRFRLSRDLRKAASAMTAVQARYLVDTYYQVQDFRIQATHQASQAEKAQEPVEFVGFIGGAFASFEGSIRAALDAYTDEQLPGRWAKSILGIGPVLAAGLLSSIDITRAPTAGAIWRLAGLEPTIVWLGEEKAKALVEQLLTELHTKDPMEMLAAAAVRLTRRLDSLSRDAQRSREKRHAKALSLADVTHALARRPWSARFRVVCWKIGESFIKVQAHEEDIYGKVYAARKALEIERNETGVFAEEARRTLATRRFERDTDARAWYEGRFQPPIVREFLALPAAQRPAFLKARRVEPGRGVPMLPPGRIHNRARRVAVKLFLAHYQHVAYEAHFGSPPPKPYVIEHLGHAGFIGPPNWPMREA